MTNLQPKIKPLSHFLRNGKLIKREIWAPVDSDSNQLLYRYHVDYPSYFSMIECLTPQQCIEVWRLPKPLKKVQV